MHEDAQRAQGEVRSGCQAACQAASLHSLQGENTGHVGLLFS